MAGAATRSKTRLSKEEETDRTRISIRWDFTAGESDHDNFSLCSEQAINQEAVVDYCNNQ